MLDFLEMLLEPVVEAVAGLFAELFGGIASGAIGGSESKVQTLLGNDVWWNSKDSL